MERVVCNPGVLGGKPVIRNTRIAVYILLDLLSEGYSFKQIIELYPHLTEEDIKACIRYAAKICQMGENVETYGALTNG